MRRLGDKIGARHLAEQAGLPVAPWSGGPVTSLAEAHRHVEVQIEAVERGIGRVHRG